VACFLSRRARRYADVFGAFGSRFAVRGGVVAVPGGPEAEAIWQAFVGESPRAPLRFLSRLVEKGEGRLAFLYDRSSRPPGLPGAGGRKVTPPWCGVADGIRTRDLVGHSHAL
jgi:hypothetical protein